MEKQIFITMDGGLIQDISISADLEGIEVTVIDFDIDGYGKEELVLLSSDNLVSVWQEKPNVIDDGDVEQFEEIIKKRIKGNIHEPIPISWNKRHLLLR